MVNLHGLTSLVFLFEVRDKMSTLLSRQIILFFLMNQTCLCLGLVAPSSISKKKKITDELACKQKKSNIRMVKKKRLENFSKKEGKK